MTLSSERAADSDYDLDHHGDADLTAGSYQLDLAVNVRLRRPPRWLTSLLSAGLDDLASYPRQDQALGAVAARHGRQQAEVLLTNGAAEAFTLIARALSPSLAVCVHPSFTAPEAALRRAGRPVRRVLLPPPFALTGEEVPAEADLVIVGNPTNPTGRLHPVAVLERLAAPGRVLVVDEAFADAIPDEPASLAGCSGLPGLLVVRSLTKAWALSGLRVGYVLGDRELISALREAQPPWPVNSLALTALTACSQPDAVAQVRRHAGELLRWRADLARRLGELPGVSVTGGDRSPFLAPFLLLKVDGGTQARHRLRELGIAVRRGDTFPGLGPEWLRIAVAEPACHDAIVAAFAACVTSSRASQADPVG
ncbi:MAG TPA: Rv2231c family pyridoxal phosphate-dependent protein CobC [Streptosporangiaceae bacterium]|nr:Rv2231c family pyridoxal phosphate-dependent protein CobC [Streptosporangiaceae bacterium]